MKTPRALLVLLLTFVQPAAAATLYRWTDASGTHRYGYQPPPGVQAVPAEEERREVYGKGPEVNCRALADRHLALIDREIARVKAMKTGLGPKFELSPAAQQALILDLLAHRSALLTGRPASEFRTPTVDEILRSKSQLQGENARLRNEVQAKEATLDAQQKRLDQARRKLRQPVVPGYYYYPGVPGLPIAPLPPVRR